MRPVGIFRPRRKSASCLRACAARRASLSFAGAKASPPRCITAATTEEVKALKREAQALKEAVADLTLENRLLKKSVIADGDEDREDEA
ncbi:hypothetical protein M2323_004464 [Rhodoblastus acidophilus]|nr:hypothetical protein [Rhodoblastus acidophilus]MCW2335515.1 hypothetical protein [Rhodoblastus acidophilus]